MIRWKASWTKTATWLNRKRNQTGMPLISRQDTYRDNPVPDSILDNYEINATLNSGLKADQLEISYIPSIDSSFQKTFMQSGTSFNSKNNMFQSTGMSF